MRRERVDDETVARLGLDATPGPSSGAAGGRPAGEAAVGPDPVQVAVADLAPAPVDRARVVDWLIGGGFSYFVDSEGDVGGLWQGRLFYFLLFGEREEIVQVRGQWNRDVTIERLEEVLELCNEWNADRIWPKAYTRVRDNGLVQVYTEVTVDLEYGANDDQLADVLQCGLSTASVFFDSLDETYPDPLRSAP
ncbi:YbjN domain-containing protein [Luteimicrobium sp. DT211]|uniref:YbjN domain-containing protein n=1 Tax=Luteimicrobium sp. DT211 TaxID=3393412 RepID=UPI003CEDFC5D